MPTEIVIDNRAVEAYLGNLNKVGTERIIRKGLAAGAVVFKAAIKAEAPVKSRASAGTHGEFSVRRKNKSGWALYSTTIKDYGAPGMLKASVQSKRIHSNPAIGLVIGPIGKGAFTRGWVTHGTKAHVIPIKIRGHTERIPHPGAKANPFVDRAVSASERAAQDIAEKVMFEEVQKL